jgi:polyisoprenoid-binding protein YceI
MKPYITLALLVCLQINATCQKFTLEKSSVTFFSDATIEDITASNKKTVSIFNLTTTDIVFSVPIAEFQFDKSLMQEHFNEKYMESDKFPKSTFQGKIIGFNTGQTIEQEVRAVGKLTIHGITRDIELPGTIQKTGDNISMKSKFIVKLQDYKIEIPQLLWENIAEQVEVTVEFLFKPQ